MIMNFNTDPGSFQDAMDFIIKLLPVFIPLFIIQLGFLVFVIVDIAKKKITKTLSPIIWIFIAISLNSTCIGPILYIIFGRAEAVAKDDDDDI